MKSIVQTAFILIACLLSGCGGDDFSAPPADLAAIRAKAKAKAEARAQQSGSKPETGAKAAVASVSSGTAAATGDETVAAESASGEESADADAVAAAPAAGTVAIESEVTSDAAASDAFAELPGAKPAAVAATETVTPQIGKADAASVSTVQDRETAAAVEGTTVSAGGQAAEQLAADKEKSTAKAGVSLLDKLRGGGDDQKDKAETRPASARANVVKRTGRMAIAAQTWLRLRNQLAKRFYVAATADGRRIAASSGEHSLGVLSTQIEMLGEELSWARRERTVAAVVTQKREVTIQPVTGLPGRITAIELIQNGDVVLVGTEDGRLIARSSANLQDWDIYAQDLFAFQDEHRPASRLAESAILAVRAVNADRLVTVDASGQCRIWAMEDVVHRPQSPLSMTPEQVRAQEAPTPAATALHSVDVPSAHVLSLSFSRSGSHGVVISDDERVTVFSVDSGRVVGEITAQQLDDTQPVAVVMEEENLRVLVGLADGRILRRALPGGTPVQGVDAEGSEVDYESVFAPDLSDRNGPITAMEVTSDGSLLYFGRLSGFVTQFDLPRKQLLRTDKLHTGPVIEIRSTPTGVFTIADDRVAKLSDVPGSSRPGTVVETFRLPADAALQASELIESDDEKKQDKFTIRRNFDGDVSDASSRLSLVGIRPSDPVLALYEHQLRVAPDEEMREEIRQKIIEQRGGSSASDHTPDYAQKPPIRVAELSTEFDFSSRPLRRAVMSLSDDGRTLAAAQFYKGGLVRGPAPDQPVFVWDTISGTVLRTWRRSSGVFDLDIDLAGGLILPTPLSARMKLFSGGYRAEPQISLSSQKSRQGQWLAVGLTGVAGTATDVVAVLGLNSEQRRTGVEAFEGAVLALAWSPDETSLFVSVREKTQCRLLELESATLQLRAEMSSESMEGPWDVSNVDIRRGTPGTTHIVPSPGGRLLATYGKYPTPGAPWQIRIWKRSGTRWSQDDVVVIDSQETILESEMTDTPMVFVNQQDSAIAVISPKGVGVIDTRSGSVSQKLELPDVLDRRPVALLSPDGKWLMAGDQDGKIWVWSLRTLKRKPQEFEAHAGPITGLAISDNSRYLATSGAENRIRIWDMSTLLGGEPQSAGAD